MSNVNASTHQTPQEGMEEATRGMSDEQLKSELDRLNSMGERTQGQEVARKVVEREIFRRVGRNTSAS